METILPRLKVKREMVIYISQSKPCLCCVITDHYRLDQKTRQVRSHVGAKVDIDDGNFQEPWLVELKVSGKGKAAFPT